jgi:FKBP-type peptidyl-prolyl cis-trans isomerase
MKILIPSLIILVSSSLFAQSKKELSAEIAKLKTEIEGLKKPKEVDLSTTDKKAAYGIGLLIATNLIAQGGDSLDVTTINFGFSDVYAKAPLKLDKQEASTIVQNYMQHAAEKKSLKLKAEGIAFLNANKTKEGVVTTASGLQYKVIKSGTGKTPVAADNVTVNYKGSTIDGSVFDSSEKTGKPATFQVGGVIAGWTEALQLMHEGDKWTLYIPADLGYGERGQGGAIPPYATLIFDVELLKVN